jgi:glutamate:GABA antiporter
MADAPQFRKVLGLRDIVAMNVVAVVGLRWISRSARIGAPAVTLWLLAWCLFFLPMAGAVYELSSRYPDQGGLYAWTRRALGPVHGFICGWCVWVNNLFYFPSLLLFTAANVLVVFGPSATALADSRSYSTIFVLGGLAFCLGLNLLGLGAGRWLQIVGSLSNWTPAFLLIVAGLVALGTVGSATNFAPRNLWPREDALGTISLWSALCFAFSGFEITSFVGQEVKEPRRTLPLGVLLAGVVVTVIYIAGSVAVLIALPLGALKERSGIADAVAMSASHIGLSGLGALTAALVALSATAGVNAWFGGAARVPFAAGVDRVLPPSFGRLDARGTPRAALVVQGVLSALIFLASVFISVGGHTSIQEAYDIMVNLTILIYFVPYLYLFVALVVLRLADRTADEGTQRVPGGTAGLWVTAASGFLATAISLALVFVPPAGTANVINYEVNLIGQAAIVLGAGIALYWFSARRKQA